MSTSTSRKPGSEVYYTSEKKIIPTLIKPEDLYQIVLVHGMSVSHPKLPGITASPAVHKTGRNPPLHHSSQALNMISLV